MVQKLADEARQNFLELGINPYPGRGIVVGIDAAGRYLVLIYWLMGRSMNSRNRVLIKGKERGGLYTAPADPSKVTDPSLIIYQAMGELTGWVYVVSNGAQTETVLRAYRGPFGLGNILRAYRKPLSFGSVLRRKYQYEPDAPNFTPRITAVCILQNSSLGVIMSILRRSPFGDACDQEIYAYEGFLPGFGRCITTYRDDGNPLPSFDSRPLLVPIGFAPIEEIAREYWNNLNAENRIALAVKMIDLKNGISKISIINGWYGKEEAV